ncbi:MAG: hypothetical protein ACRD4Y_12345 [Candidatus Acidiferrales bacterium]
MISTRPTALIIVVVAALCSLSPAVFSFPQGPPAGKPSSESSVPVGLPKGKKLILKDGTFQLVREYAIQGDRVRYWSVERSAWEEIPASLVDWDATRKGEVEQAAEETALKAKIHASRQAELARDIDIDRSLEIKPGLFLPDGVGFYALDGKLIFPMKQSQAVAKLSTGREVERILTGMPVIPEKETLSIPGKRAAMRLSTDEPEFFMRPSDEREPKFRLLRAEVKDGKRVLDNISISFTGAQTHKADEIEIETWTPARGVFRYTVNQRLAPGEYAFVEITEEGVSGYVWEFGIDRQGTKKLH